jgi:hypothetical protein
MYESGAQKSCIQKTNAIFSIYKMSEQQKLGKIQKAKKFVTKLKRKSMKTYFLERCSGGTKSSDFCKTITKRGPVENKKLCLMNLTRL